MPDEVEKKYIIYVRRSQDREDKQVASIPDQLEATNRIKTERGLAVVANIQDEKTAKKPGRPGFDRMVEMLQSGEAQGVICWHANRLSRNAKDSGVLQWLMDDSGVEIITPYQIYNEHNSSTSFKTDTGQAEQFSKDLSKVVRRSNKTHFRSGKWLGPAPVGYINAEDPVTKDRVIVQDPQRFDVIRKSWDLLLSGMYRPAEISRILTDEYDFTMRRTRQQGGGPMRLGALVLIFRNPFYYGLMVRTIDGEHMESLGNYPPMITKNEFDKAQQILGHNERSKPPMDMSTGLNGSAIKCGECGYSVTFEHHQAKNKTYARCTKKSKHGCSQGYLNIDKLVPQVEEDLAKVTISDEFIDWAIDYLISENQNEQQEKATMRVDYERRLRETNDRLNRLLDVYLDDPTIMSKEQYQTKKKELEDQARRFREYVEAVGDQSKSWLELTKERLEFARDALKEFQLNDARMRHHIVKTIGGSNLRLTDGELDFEPVRPYIHLYKNTEFLRSVSYGSPDGI